MSQLIVVIAMVLYNCEEKRNGPPSILYVKLVYITADSPPPVQASEHRICQSEVRMFFLSLARKCWAYWEMIKRKQYLLLAWVKTY